MEGFTRKMAFCIQFSRSTRYTRDRHRHTPYAVFCFPLASMILSPIVRVFNTPKPY